MYEADLAYIHAMAFEDLARGAAPEIVRRLRAAPIPVHHVVEVGCGSGALTQALLAEGWSVTAIDPSASFLKIARKAAPGARFIEASIYEVTLPPCEAILAVGEPLTYHRENTGEARIGSFFEQAAAALPPGGLLVFDLIEQGEPSLTARTWRSGDDWAVLVDTVESGSRLTRTIETFRQVGNAYRRTREVHHVQVFDSSSILNNLAARGFSVATRVAYGTQALARRRRAFFATR